MYYVTWWNANGDACQSELMAKEQAELFAKGFWPEQEAQLMFVWVR